jgi:hypothetical protein
MSPYSQGIRLSADIGDAALVGQHQLHRHRGTVGTILDQVSMAPRGSLR